MWEIEYYVKRNGRCPIEDFLDDLSPKDDIPYIENKLEMLAELGYKLDDPHVHFLRDDIYELRVKTINGQFRLLYFFVDGGKIIITHGFKKKSSKVPAGEKKLAVEYRKDYYTQQKEMGKR